MGFSPGNQTWLAGKRDPYLDAFGVPLFEGSLISMAISGIDSWEVPTICKAYVRGYPHEI